MTLKELQSRAAELDIAGRSKMNKTALSAAIAKAEAAIKAANASSPKVASPRRVDSPSRLVRRNSRG